MINVTGLWVQKDKSGNVIKDKNGNPMIAGNLGGLRVLIFKNARKQEDKHPDYNLVFAANEPKDKPATKPEAETDVGF